MCFFRKRRQAKLEAKRQKEEQERLAREEAEAKARAEEEARIAEAKKQEELAQAKEVKKAPAKKAPAKKAAPKKATAPKAEPKAEAAPSAAGDKNKSVYHVAKREEDGMWQIKYTGGRVIKLCKTKQEAMDYAKEMAERQEGTVIFHPSKGANKGKFQKA